MHTTEMKWTWQAKEGRKGRRRSISGRMTHRLNNVIEVALSAEHTTRPADNPVAIWDESRAFSGAAFEDVENVPYVIQGEFRLAHAHAQPEEGRFPFGSLRLLGIR